jgi:hypothetical protein
MTYPYQAIIEGIPRKIFDVDAEGKYKLDGGQRLELNSPEPLPIRSRPLKRVAKLTFDGQGWFLDGESAKVCCIDAQMGRRAGREGRTEEQTMLELIRRLDALPLDDRWKIAGVAWFRERAGRVEGETAEDCEQRKEFLANRRGCETIEPLSPADRFKPVFLTDFGIASNYNSWTAGISKALGLQTDSASSANMLENGNPFLAGLDISTTQPIGPKPIEEAQAAASLLKNAGDEMMKKAKAVSSDLRAAAEQLAEVAEPLREMYKDQRLACAKADALKAKIPELVVDTIVSFHHASKLPTTDGLVKYLNSSGLATKLEAAGNGTSRATVGRWLATFKQIMRRRGLIQQTSRKAKSVADSTGGENISNAPSESGQPPADTRAQELPEGSEDGHDP